MSSTLAQLTTRSGRSHSSMVTANEPLGAAATSYPASISAFSRAARLSISASAMRTFACGIPDPSLSATGATVERERARRREDDRMDQFDERLLVDRLGDVVANAE